jgi:predicted O-methyltransferase YrrM
VASGATVIERMDITFVALVDIGQTTNLPYLTPGMFDMFALPDIGVEPGVRKGRVPRDGYQRGWGLQHTELRTLVEGEDLFRRAFAASEPLASIVSPDRRANLYLILTRFMAQLANRNIIEFGSFRGGNAIFMATVMREIAPEAMVYALDTFAGMPETDPSIDAHGKGDFSESSLQGLLDHASALGLSNLVAIRGLFQDTFPTIEQGIGFGLAHIDADIYSGVKYAQDAVWSRVTKGGYIVFDDAIAASCIGATQAVEELIQDRGVHSEQIWPHFVFRVGLDDDDH